MFDYTFSRNGRLAEFVGTGLGVTFLSLDECQRGLAVDGKTLVLQPYTIKSYHQSPAKVTYDCIYGDRDLVAHYQAALERRTCTFERIWQRPLLRPSP